MPIRELNGVSIHYVELGAGPPTLLLAGLGGKGSSWGSHQESFAESFRTIVPDHRGTGESSKPPDGYTITQHAADMAALLRALRATPAHIVGVSTGGAIAMAMALDHPETVRSLTLVASWGRSDDYLKHLFAMRKQVLLGLDQSVSIALTLHLLHSPRYLHENWPQILETERRLSSASIDVAISASRIDMVMSHDVLDRLRNIRVPTMIMVGEDDVLTPPHLSSELLEHMSGAEFHLIPQCGHSVHVEQPSLFMTHVTDFLRRAG
jgi:aminoacrylate hydrolase